MNKQPFSLVDTIPNSIDLEKSLLGAIIFDGKTFDQVRNYINCHDFALPQHQKLFQAMEEMFNSNIAITSNLLLDKLKSSNLLELIGGEIYFVELYQDVHPNSEFFNIAIIECAKRIKIKSTRRKLMELFVQGISKTKEDTLDTDSELDVIISKISNANSRTIESPYELLHEIGGNYLISKAMSEFSPINSGFPSLDALLGGFKKKHLVTIAAEPSMGKTSFAWHIAINMAAKLHPVAYLSLEMTKEEMYKKALSVYTGMSDSEIDLTSISSPKIDLFNKLNKTSFKDLSLYLTDQTLNILEIKRTTRLMKEKHNIQVLFLDHLHFMQSKKPHETRNAEISLITSELKALAKELDITIVMLSQLNRASSHRPSEERRPLISDLRDSGSIAQDSDVVMFIYREGEYKQEIDPKITEIIIRKNRGGRRNVTANLVFDGATSSFYEPYYQEEAEYSEQQQSAVKRQAYLMKD